jgi:nicotinamide mononucleotide transporter
MTDFVAALQRPALGAVTWAELVGDTTGLACVWLMARQHLLTWPLGIVNNLMFIVLFWSSKLYGDAVLQCVFAVMGAYGWWRWVRDAAPIDTVAGAAIAAPIRRMTPREWTALVPLTAVATIGAAWWLSRHTDSPVPLWDATVLCLSLAATWAQAVKRLETWWLWIAVNVLSIPLYVVRHLLPTAVLYALFLVICVGGLRSWTREWRAGRTSP